MVNEGSLVVKSTSENFLPPKVLRRAYSIFYIPKRVAQ
jgi:hypothetical protein